MSKFLLILKIERKSDVFKKFLGSRVQIPACVKNIIPIDKNNLILNIMVAKNLRLIDISSLEILNTRYR